MDARLLPSPPLHHLLPLGLLFLMQIVLFQQDSFELYLMLDYALSILIIILKFLSVI